MQKKIYEERNREYERSSRFLTFERWSGKCESDSNRGKEIRANENEEEKRRRVDETNKRVTLLRSKRSEEQKMEKLKLKRNIYKNSMILRDNVEEEFDKIDLKHKRRLFRSRRTQAEKAEENMKAREGMQKLRETWPKRIIKRRTRQNFSEFEDWQRFVQKSKRHAEMAASKKPDIVQKINEKERERREVNRKRVEKEQEIEKERQKKIKEDGGEWEYNAEYDHYKWIGEGEPIEGINDDCPLQNRPHTKQELEELRQQEEKELEEFYNEKKRIAKEKRKEKNEKIKAAMKVPIGAPPVKEMSKYEKIRLNIIKEREQAMAESGFFDDLLQYKKNIGLL